MSRFAGNVKEGDDYAITPNTPYGGAQQSLITDPKQLAQINADQQQFADYFYELNPYGSHGESFWDVLTDRVLPLFATAAVIGTAVYGIAGAIAGAGAAGAGAGAAGAGGIGAEGIAGLGAVAETGGGLGGLAGLGEAGAIGIAGGAPAVVSIGAPAAAGGLGGLGAVGAVGAGLGGLASMGGNGAVTGSPTTQPPPDGMQQVVIGPPTTPTAAGVGAGAPLALGGAAVAGGLLSTNPTALQQLPNVNGAAPTSNVPPPIGAGNIPSTLPIPPFGVPNVNGPPAAGSTPTSPSTPGGGTGGLGGLGNVIGGLIGGNVDRIKAEQDSEWWKSQIDTLMGMYKPGTPEAEQMRQKMEAQDAMTGRRSQYGTRAVNLATNLAEKRAGIMTSAGYQNMANAYRQRSSQDLAGLFGAMGANGGMGNTIGNIVNGLGGLFGGS